MNNQYPDSAIKAFIKETGSSLAKELLYPDPSVKPEVNTNIYHILGSPVIINTVASPLSAINELETAEGTRIIQDIPIDPENSLV